MIETCRPDLRRGKGTIIFIDKRILFVIVTPHHIVSGRNSGVECHLAKVDVDGSNPFARSIFLIGGIAKWLRQRSAKPLFPGSNPGAASSHKGGAVELAPFFLTQYGSQLSGIEIYSACAILPR